MGDDTKKLRVRTLASLLRCVVVSKANSPEFHTFLGCLARLPLVGVICYGKVVQRELPVRGVADSAVLNLLGIHGLVYTK